ncbi:MAG: hypothetical protein HOP15_11770, partial [Planctomycetes bacterium]|nr:hypothetical protein [Planctomycetota bacterium]
AAPLADARGRLLDLAYEAASAMPLVPHVKNRSRAQDGIVAASLELDQPERASRYAAGIENWRRGAGYADVAFHYAQAGAVSEAERCLELARQVAESHENEFGDEETSQAWRRDRIRAKIARTYVWLGRSEEAARFAEGLEDSEIGAVEVVQAMRTEAGAFDERLKALDAVVATGSFERVRAALAAYTQLIDRSYADEEKREEVVGRIRGATKKVPATVQIEVWEELAEVALARGDKPKTLAVLAEARSILEASRWNSTSHIPLAAGLGALRFRAGEEREGRAEVDAARARYARERETIVDIERAGVLRALAEACQTMGNVGAARELYAQAVEAGVANPNSRPRAEDLAATCCSMAVHAFEPDAALWSRLAEVRAGLSDPW